jgi:threonine/homoserine/homoserine lactone efflux protein
MMSPFLTYPGLFLATFLLALAPNLAVLIVTTRAASAGFKQGAWATFGIVSATVLHVFVAVFLLMIVAAMRPEARQVLRLIAAVYLVWSGMNMIRNATRAPLAALPPTQRSAASFATGFLLTLLNVKAILFYVCFLPAFVNVGILEAREVLVVVGVLAAAGFLARMFYVTASAQGRIVPGVLTGRILNVIAGVVVAAAGVGLVTGVTGRGLG